MKKLRILVFADAPHLSTGYSLQARYLLPRFKELPEIEAVAAFARGGIWGAVVELNGIPTYPMGALEYSPDVVTEFVRDFRADVYLTIIDAWTQEGIGAKVAPALYLPWFPVEADPIPNATLAGLQGAWRPLVFSEWGGALMQRRGWPHAVIPLGVEPTVMRVLSPDVRARFRQEIAVPPDAFLAVMVAMNQDPYDRKGFEQQLRAFAHFAAQHPDAYLYCHTEATAQRGGMALHQLVRLLGIEDRVRFPASWQLKKGFAHEHIAHAFNAADVLLAASRAEGFCVPIVEAESCGLPVITSDFGPMTELLRWGVAVPPLDWSYTPADAYVIIPDAHGIYQALEQAFVERQRPDLQNLRWAVSRQMHAEYGFDTLVQKHWQPLFAEIAAVLDTPKAPPLREWNGLRRQPLARMGSMDGLLPSVSVLPSSNGHGEPQSESEATRG